MTTRKKRNPLFGILFSVLFIGFGSYRLYNHFIELNFPADWRIAMPILFIAYGLFILYQLVADKYKSE